MKIRGCILVASLLVAGAMTPLNAVGEQVAEVILTQKDRTKIGEPAEVIYDHWASEGKAISLGDSGQGDYYGGIKAGRGFAEFKPQIPESGQYRMWVRLQWHCTCSRNLAIESSANHIVATNGNKVAGRITNVSDAFQPRAWHWLDCGSFEFKKGLQEIALVQAGHFVLIDSVALGAGDGYLPPNYVSAEDIFLIEDCPLNWRKPVGERVEHILGDRVWTNPKLDVSIPLSIEGFVERRGKIGIEFCRQPNESSYELSVESAGKNMVSATLYLREEGKPPRLLAKRDSVDWRGQYHHVQLFRAVDEIAVKMDGWELLNTVDSTLPPGTISLFGESVNEFNFEELEIIELNCIDEQFGGGIQGWVPQSGSWRTIGTENGRTYLGTIDNSIAGVSKCSWPLRSSYEFAVAFRHVAKGGAGLAFGIDDKENFYAAAVVGDGAGVGDACKLEVLKFIEGKRHLMSSRSLHGAIGQWFQLSLRRAPGVISFEIDGVKVGPFETDEKLGDKAGLFVESEEGAEFATVRARDVVENDSCDFLFEPEMEVRSMSCFRLLRGELQLDQHPATVTLQSNERDGREVYLQLNTSIVPNTDLTLSIAPIEIQARKNSDAILIGDIETLAVSTGASFLDEPEFGISLVLAGPEPIEYRVSVDKSTMRRLSILRNGQLLAKDFGTRANGLKPQKLHVNVNSDGTITAEMGNQAKVSSKILEVVDEASEFVMAIFGKNLQPTQPLRFDRFSIERRYPELDATTVSEAQ